MRWSKLFKRQTFKTLIATNISQNGFHLADPIDSSSLKKIIAIYKPRCAFVLREPSGHPFKNIFETKDIDKNNPVFQLAFSPKILDVATDYFRGKLILDSIQVLYSYSTNNETRESQFWHLDYNDRKSFHAIIYLNDVLSENDGPFVFLDKQESKGIGRSFVVRRIPDNSFYKNYGNNHAINFFSKAGGFVYVDPAACYHYGSRCKNDRLAIFVTFSSWFPFVKPVNLIINNRRKILIEAKLLRPDLSNEFLKNLLQ